MQDVELYNILSQDTVDRELLEEICAPVPVAVKIDEFYHAGLISEQRAAYLQGIFGTPVNQEVLEMRVEGVQQQGLAVADWTDLVEYVRRELASERLRRCKRKPL